MAKAACFHHVFEISLDIFIELLFVYFVCPGLMQKKNKNITKCYHIPQTEDMLDFILLLKVTIFWSF